MRILNDLTAKTTKIESSVHERKQFAAVRAALEALRTSHPNEKLADACGEANERLDMVIAAINADAPKPKTPAT